MSYIDQSDIISKHDDHAYDGHMTRITFSRMMSSIQEQLEDLKERPAYNEEGNLVDEGFVGILKRERNRAIDEAIDIIANQHTFYLETEPNNWDGDPTYAELAEIPTLEEWERMKKDKWQENRRKEAYKNLEKAVMKKHEEQLAWEKEEEERQEEYRKKWEAEHPEQAAQDKKREQELIDQLKAHDDQEARIIAELEARDAKGD